MTQNLKCPQCGADLPRAALQGLCPKCLVHVALEGGEDTAGSAIEAHNIGPAVQDRAHPAPKPEETLAVSNPPTEKPGDKIGH